MKGVLVEESHGKYLWVGLVVIQELNLNEEHDRIIRLRETWSSLGEVTNPYTQSIKN